MSALNLTEFRHDLNISLMSNEKELEKTKFRHLSKLRNLPQTLFKTLQQLSLMIQKRLFLIFRLSNCHLVIEIFFLKDFLLIFHLK